MSGLPLSDYLIREVRKIAEQPTPEEMRAPATTRAVSGQGLAHRDRSGGARQPIDASALLELLLGTDRAEHIASRALAPEERLHAPHLLDIETAQTLRRLTQLGDITASRTEQALDDYAALVVERHGHQDLLPRIWQLRESVTAYGGAYVALAEALDAPLLTCDTKLGRSHGHRARLEIVE